MNDKVTAHSSTVASALAQSFEHDRIHAKGRYMAKCYGEDGELKWVDYYDNAVMIAGKNDMLDKYLSGSAYTGAFYVGLIGGVSYTAAPIAGDTMSSHAGWNESGDTRAPAYSQTFRPTAAWAAASGGAKALSTPASFTFTSPGTVKGSFISTNSNKESGTGVLFSAGLFAGGDKVVAAGDTLQVSYSLTV